MLIITAVWIEASQITFYTKHLIHYLNQMKCPLCNYHSTTFLLKGDAREYWFCGNCYLVFVPLEFFISKKEEIARYLEHNNTLNNEGYVKMFQKKINTINKTCLDINTVLDYGCGYEPVLKTLLGREGYQADGYDLNFYSREELGKKYDLVISTETFEHIKKPGEDLARLMSKISSKGYLAIMTRFYPLKKRALCLESFSEWYYKRDPTHIAFYSQKTFSWIAHEFKMKICYNNNFDFTILQKNQ
jgi:hypothetical protein